MKKQAIILIFVITAFSSAYAQKGKVTAALNYLTNQEIGKAWEAIQAAEKNEKTVGFSKTYYVKGKILQAISESKDEKVKKLVEDPLPKAYEAYKKSISMDEKHKIDKSVDIQLPMLNNDFINLGIVKFQDKDYSGALTAFETSLEIGKNKIFAGIIDTNVVYNAGLAAYNGKVWEKAIQYFGQAKDLGYGGTNVYQLMHVVYLNQGDTVKAENIMKEGVDAYPDDHNILLGLLQYFLDTGKDKDALSYLSTAKEKEPDNKVLWYVEGLLYDRSGKDFDKALAAYEKAIELDPEYYDPYYNSGVILFNKGVAMYNDANQIMDNAKFKVAKEEADKIFGSSISYFVKITEIINPKEVDPGTDKFLTYKNALENLKILYYRLQMPEKRKEIMQKIEELNK